MSDTVVEKAVVPVKSPWYSKINWGELVKVVAMLSAIWGYPIPEDVQGHAILFLQYVVSAITLVGGLYTFVVKTWFSGSVTPQSLPAKVT